jgi:hypothetical protein
MDHEPGSFVMDIEQPFQKCCGTSPLIRSDQVYSPEPLSQWKMGTVEHGVRGQRGLKPTMFALEYFPRLNKISFITTASGTIKYAIPSCFFEILKTLLFRLKVFLKLEKLHLLVCTHLYPHHKVIDLIMV